MSTEFRFKDRGVTIDQVMATRTVKWSWQKEYIPQNDSRDTGRYVECPKQEATAVCFQTNDKDALWWFIDDNPSPMFLAYAGHGWPVVKALQDEFGEILSEHDEGYDD